MNWKLKAAIQNAVALLPPSISYAIYYRLQRLAGGLRRTDPVEHLTAGVETWRRIIQQERNPVDKLFFEVGTGRAPIVPLAYWLMGAKRTITVDVNPYLKGELVRETVEYIYAQQEAITAIFGSFLQQQRLDALLQFRHVGSFSLRRFLELCCIEYIEPGDAGRTSLPPASIDFHTSYTVFEHIPPDVLARILGEGNRIVRDRGLFVHMIDYSDHFSHSDPTISAINFLRFADAEWVRYAGNRYMYMNRMRHDDVLALFEAAGQRILAVTAIADEHSRALLEAGRLRLNEKFQAKSLEILSMRGSWIVSETIRSCHA